MRDTVGTRRQRMVERHLAGRGLRDLAVLEAMESLPREAFVPPEMEDFAYEDTPLPIGEGQTISQPYVVALMAEALELGPGDRVLEIGTGSGYAAAILARIADEVYTVERHAPLAEGARRVYDELGVGNVHVRHGDGTLGWPEHAPYDAIVVAAGGPDVPEALKEQLAPGGRLVIPVGETPRTQELVRLRKDAGGGISREDLGAVRFVPLIGAQGWAEEGPDPTAHGDGARDATAEGEERAADREAPDRGAAARGRGAPATAAGEISLPEIVRDGCEPFDQIGDVELDGLLERIGDARVVLLGEASHGTAEFYEMRDRITRELIERKGFRIVAVEADWPDAAQLDHFVRNRDTPPPARVPFTRFPTWMWANREVQRFVEWLRDHNLRVSDPDRRVGFFGLDLYSLYTSIEAVLRYLDEEDVEAARSARTRYGCLSPWEGDAATYGRAALSGRFRDCEDDVVAVLSELLERRMEDAERDGYRFLDAVQNARVVQSAERYYRIMYHGGTRSWNLRDQHMFDTLVDLLAYHGPGSKAVVWEHNSHIGDASATEMGARGQHNVGQLCRRDFGDGAYLVGFGTHRGTVAAAHDWDEPMRVMEVRSSHERSYERVCHDAGTDRFLLPLRHPGEDEVRRRLLEPRLERAIGVVYRPETELMSHYFQAVLPRQFDEYVWFDDTRAVTPLERDVDRELTPETFPFGL